ncbi:MAG: dTDP-4-dehydrorhamnose 3,5-epimerase [Candidatus Firestonebacteria bacterium]|nr:dTDP-4-dehydrorhamnose 3,5-epimerase [Candidatus Firestonebacteria bacterium]
MKFMPTALPGVVLIEPKIFTDDRGFFFESYHQQRFEENHLPGLFVQDNHSLSARGVIRGLHYQLDPAAQGKLVRVIRGAIFDVAVDIRPGSSTYRQWFGTRLDTQNRHMLFIPAGYAHGFCALEDNTEVAYKVTALYSPVHDRGVRWDDPDIGIAWPEPGIPYRISEKDRALPLLRDI